MKDYIFSKEYLYKFWKGAVHPLLEKYVKQTDNELDDSIVLAVDKLMDSLLKPKEEPKADA